MELVTLAHVTFNRVGSASQFGVVTQTQVRRVVEVPDENPQTLRGIVLDLAEQSGECRESLDGMRQVHAIHYNAPMGAVVFNIQGPDVQYGSPYAICYVHPALKIGERYFKLDEVEI